MRLREETGIATLKVRYTRVFGWYIEVTRAQAARAPTTWRRKQTVAGGERFTLPELDDLADKILHAEERHRARELELFTELVNQVKAANPRITSVSERVARWDVSAALAEVAHRYDYRRPEVDDSDALEIVDGRHPVVERLAAAGRFVPNDVSLHADAGRVWIVTGPNMAGKSTLLRQVALSVILAQLGSFVPAKSARVGVVDRVLSRVGASDNVSGGESTFMVEMRETAEILRKATPRSVVILDEIGRGTKHVRRPSHRVGRCGSTSTRPCKCRTLFATHYHELTAPGRTRGAKNVAKRASVMPREIGGRRRASCTASEGARRAAATASRWRSSQDCRNFARCACAPRFSRCSKPERPSSAPDGLTADRRHRSRTDKPLSWTCLWPHRGTDRSGARGARHATRRRSRTHHASRRAGAAVTSEGKTRASSARRSTSLEGDSRRSRQPTLAVTVNSSRS